MAAAATIRRSAHGVGNDYFLMLRASAQDDRLSYEARGVLVYLLSKADNWEAQVNDLQRNGCGRDKVYKIINELADAGYITKRERTQKADGTWQWTPYIVYESPQPDQKPLPEKPEVVEGQDGSPLPGLPYTVNQEILNNTDLNNTENDNDDPDIASLSEDKSLDKLQNDTGEYATDGEGEDRTADIDGKENTEETPTPAFTGEIELPNNRQAQLMRKLGIDESQIAKYHKLPHEKVQNICHIARVKGGAGAPGYAVVMFQDLEKNDQRAALLASTEPPAPSAPEQAPNNYAKKSANVLHFGPLLQKGEDGLPAPGAFAQTAKALHNLSDSQLAEGVTQPPSDPAKKAWAGVLAQLALQLPDAQYATSVKDAQYVRSDSEGYTVAVPHAYAQQQCIRIQRTIEAVLRTVAGEAYQIEFVIQDDEKVKA